MSVIAITTIYLRKSYSPQQAELVDEILNRFCDEVMGTRKDRFWEFVKNDRIYNMDIRPTDSVLLECEDELLKINLVSKDVPEMICIT